MFFFKQKRAYEMRISDWSSDVCSSDLRKYQKSRAEERLDKVVRLADQLGLPRATVTGGDRPLPSLPPSTAGLAVRQTSFPEPAVETAYPTEDGRASCRGGVCQYV